jgi:hypothetical protein
MAKVTERDRLIILETKLDNFVAMYVEDRKEKERANAEDKREREMQNERIRILETSTIEFKTTASNFKWLASFVGLDTICMLILLLAESRR